MTIPSSQTHLLPLLLLAATLVAMAATADQQQPTTAAPVTLPGCPDKCGDVSIPYPFGMKDGCFLPGFEVVCNETFDPPRAFLSADNPISVDKNKKTRPFMVVRDLYYSSIQIQLNQTSQEINVSRSPVELIDISVSQGQARVYGAFSFDCSSNETYHSQRIQSVYFPYTTPFLPWEENMLTVIGRKVEARLSLGNNVDQLIRTAGWCFGKGWCQQKIAPKTRGTKVKIKRQNNTDWRTSPCSYGMVVEKSWYNFSGQDLEGDSFLKRNVARGVPVVLDFTVRSGLCPGAGQPEPEGYACASGNSSCVNGTIYPGHCCMCCDGYQGNPYIPNGCQDIDECDQPDLYPCHGKCENRLGGYNCTCPHYQTSNLS